MPAAVGTRHRPTVVVLLIALLLLVDPVQAFVQQSQVPRAASRHHRHRHGRTPTMMTALELWVDFRSSKTHGSPCPEGATAVLLR